MSEFQPPPFQSHLVLRGGHLQTIASIATKPGVVFRPTQHVITVSHGDSIVLHQDRPPHWTAGDPSMLLIHGLSGCHGAPYMLRLADRFFRAGWCVFRMDMRGCGAAVDLARNLTHAGRSDDVVCALRTIAEQTVAGPIAAIGVSLGANQLLRAVGRIGAGVDSVGDWFARLERIATVAPPVDLQRCSDNMQRLTLRLYNYYFIRSLLTRTPSLVRQRQDFQQSLVGGRPRTLRELDDRFTAPLSGFVDAADYYRRASAKSVIGSVTVPTLVLAAQDDPIVPIGCFVDDPDRWSDSIKLVVAKSGGHVGFIDRRKQSWMDRVLHQWFQVD